MTGKHLTLFAVFGALLVITGVPAGVQASANLVVGSSHSTDTDFNNASKLDNVTVKGAGKSAYVKHSPADGVESTPSNGDGLSSVGESGSDYFAQSFVAENGTIATIGLVLYEHSAEGEVRLGLAPENANGDPAVNSTLWKSDLINPEGEGSGNATWFNVSTGGVSVTPGETYYIIIDGYSNSGATGAAGAMESSQYTDTGEEMKYSNDGGASWSTYVGPLANMVQYGNNDSGTYISANHSSTASKIWSNVTLSNASATITTKGWNGTNWVQVSSTTVSSTNNYTIDVAGANYEKWRLNVTFRKTGENHVAKLHDEGVLFDAKTPDADATNANPKDNADENNEDVKLSVPVSDPDFSTPQGDSVTVDFVVDGTVIETQTITSNQTVTTTTSGLSDGDHTWHVEITDSYGESSTSSTWNFTVNHYPPVFDDSSASPSDNLTIDKKEVVLSVPINDTDFAETSGDSVNAEIYYDGQVVDTQTVSKNGTISTTLTSMEGGDHSWHVEATDEYGFTTTSENYTFNVPDTLYIYNESAPGTLIDGSVSVEVTFFEDGGEQIVTRTTSNGTLNMTGLNVGSEFIVRVEASDYYDRTIVVDSIHQQQSVYLLHKNVTTVENRFVLDDLTGQFGDETQVIIQRPLTINGTTSYKRVVGADFGVTGHTTNLEKGIRYRILVESESTQRVIGSYTANTNGSITLEVGEIVYPKPDSDGVAFAAEEIEENAQELIRVRYNDTADLTEKLTISIYERGNKSNVLTSYSQTDVQTVVIKEPVANNETSYVVNVTAIRGDTTFAVTYPIGGNYGVPLPIDGTWLGTISMVFLVFTTALYQSRLATVGSIIVVFTAGTMMLFQFMTIEPLAWWAAAAIAVGGHIRETAGGDGI